MITTLFGLAGLALMLAAWPFSTPPDEERNR